MSEIEYILRIILRARDETAAAFRLAREQLRGFITDAERGTNKLEGFNTSMKNMEKNMGNVTTKLREWRAVMQGLGDDNKEASKSVGQLGREMDTVVKKTTAAARSQKELTQETSRLRQQWKELDKAQKDKRVSDEVAVDGFKRIGRELDTVSNKLNLNTRQWQRAREWAQDAKRSAQDIIDAEKAQTRAMEEQARRRSEIARQQVREREQLAAQVRRRAEQAEREAQRAQAAAEREEKASAARRLREYEAGVKRQLAADERARAQRHEARLKDLREEEDYNNRVIAASERRANIVRKLEERPSVRRRDRGDFDAALRGQLQLLEREYRELGRHTKLASDDQDHFATSLVRVRNELRNLDRDTSRSSGFLHSLSQAFDRNSGSLSKFDNQLRGMGILLLVSFAQQLITALTGLAGSLASVASSAAMAGAALGGAFVAGIGEALPAIGLFAAALFRVKSVMDAVQQAQMLQQQTATRAPAAARRQANATDAIANAEDALKNAHEGVADAQDRLTEAQGKLVEARRQARRDLEDLIRAENDARLAALGAALSQKEAQQALVRAQATGDVEGIQRAQLALLQAQSEAQDKLTQKRRAAADADRARAGGVEGMPGVRQAKKDIEDAEKAAAKAADSVEKAQRGVERARRGSDAASAGAETAAAKLQFLLAQLSPAERRLYEAITRIQKLFREGVYRDITDNLVNSFARSIEKITRIIQQPAMVNAARRMSQEMARQFDRIFDAFTSERMLAQFRRISEAGRHNLKPLTDIAIDFGKALANIAEEAGPSLNRLLTFVGRLARDFLNLTDRKKAMTDFFETGEKHFEAWVNLILSVIRLFMALTGAGGAESGLRTIQDATKAIDDLTKKVNDNRDGVGKFFEDARHIAEKVVEVIVALGKELFKSFTPERIDKFAKLLTDVVIPALGDAVTFLGQVNQIIVEIADTDIGKNILKATIAAFILYNVFGTALSTLTKMRGAVDLISAGVKGVKGFAGLGGRAGGGLAGEGAGAAETFLAGGAGGEAAGVGAAAATASTLAWVAAIGALIAAVVLLLEKFGLLDDMWDAIKGAFAEFYKQVKPSIEGLVSSIGDLIDAFQKRGGLLDALKPIFDVFVALSKVVLPTFGRMLGRIVGGAIDVLKGLVDILTGILTLDFSRFLRGFRTVFSGLTRIVTAPMRAMLENIWGILKLVAGLFRRAFSSAFRVVRDVVGDIIDWLGDHWREIISVIRSPFGTIVRIIVSRWDDIKGAFRAGVNAVVDFMRKLPGRLKHYAEDAADVVVEAFKGVGEAIIKGIVSGLKSGAGFARDLANAFIDLLNNLLPNKISVPHAPDINLPDNPIPHLAAGGPVPGSGSGDKIAALLEPGEHVWTKDEVRRAGGHAAMYAMRAFFGGGGQSYGRGMQAGGAPGAGGGALTIGFRGGDLDDFRSVWRFFWNSIVTVARRGANAVEKQFDDMRINTGHDADQMYKRVRGSIADIQNSFRVRGSAIVNSWSSMWDSLMKVAYDGLFYIGHETNRALHGLGEKTINFGLTEPKKSNEGKAGGGWIGSQGHRGRDRGLYPLGAGEAVLNWQHQRYVEPAMHAYYGHGLGTMFNRVHGYHAGGAEQTGFAAGGIVPIPGFPGESIASSILGDVMKLVRQYKLMIYDGFGGSPPHAPNSDHLWGGAIDVGPGPGGSWDLIDKLAHWAEPRQNAPRKPFRWVGYDGDPGHGRGNHLHLSWIKGAHLGNTGDFITQIARSIVTGPDGGLKTFVQSALDKVLKVANSYLDEKVAATIEPGEMSGGKIPALGPGAANTFRFFKSQGFTDAQAAGWVGNFAQESGNDPTAVQKGGPGRGLAQWGGGRFQMLQQFAASHGKPWTDMGTQLAFVMYELHGPESAAFRAIKAARTVEEATDAIGTKYERFGIQGDRSGPARAALREFGGKFAKGGIVPGGDGTPIGVIAHAGEWILNKAQQLRMAELAGLHPSSLASMLGFHGGGRHYQGGGDITEEISPLTTKEVKGISDRTLRRMIVLVRALERNFNAATIRLGDVNTSVDVWNKYIDRTRSQLNGIRARIRESDPKGKNFERGVKGFLDSLDSLTREGGVFDQLRAAIEQRATVAQRRLVYGMRRVGGRLAETGRFTVGAGRVVSERQEEAEQAQLALAEQRRQRGDLTDERQRLQKELQQVERESRQKGLTTKERERLNTQRSRLRSRINDADQRIADNVQAIYDAQEAYRQALLDAQQEITDKITKRYERASAANDRLMRVASALGDDDATVRLTQAQRSLMEGQANELEARIGAIRALGTQEATDLADSIADQVADLRTQIFESIQQEIKDAVDRINANAQRRMGHLDLGGRLLDALGVFGFTGAGGGGARTPFLNQLLAQMGIGGTFSRAGLLQARGQVMQQQYGALQGQLGLAQAQGNIGLIKDLTDQLAELEVAIQENTKEAFNSRVEDVTTRSSYNLNILDLKKQIIELDGTIGGQIDQQAIIANLMERDAELRNTGNQLLALYNEAVAAGDEQAARDLYQQLLENEVATKQNTQAINEATGAVAEPQTFSSSAWQWFREAIFSGMGQVLPQYDPAQATVTGAQIVPATATTNNTVGGTSTVNIYEAGGPIDVQAVTSAIAFTSKTAQ